MANPFKTRATELVNSSEAFLSLVAPDPITLHLVPQAADEALFSKLISLQGQPGSGKTTIGRCFEFSTLAALMRSGNNANLLDLMQPLQKCHAISKGRIQILACRLPLESDYRELWQLPYDDNIKSFLFERLIQARAVLAWLHQLRREEIQIEEVSILARDNSHSSVAFIGGSEGREIFERAKLVEESIYRIIGSLRPVKPDQFGEILDQPYQPFEVIHRFLLESCAAERISSATSLIPVVILDDAHFLHPEQLQSLKNWLIKRELDIGRWVLSRLDVLKPSELFESLLISGRQATTPGVTVGRDLLQIDLQNVSRKNSRRNFSAMARRMSSRYLRALPIFEQNSITSIEPLLDKDLKPLAESKVAALRFSVRKEAEKYNVFDERLEEFRELSIDFLQKRDELREDFVLAIVRILIHRYSKRTPQSEMDFLKVFDPAPSKPLKVDKSVYDAARIHLYHQFDLPYYCGFDALASASSENAETFLHLCGHYVDFIQNLLIKQRRPSISAITQHNLLVERSKISIEQWSFPECARVRAIIDWIGNSCLKKTLELNAPLGAGANAFGILQSEFDLLQIRFPILAETLKFAVSYNAITFLPEYECKGKTWCLLELGGVSIVQKGLTFMRGGFVEGTAEDLAKSI